MSQEGKEALAGALAQPRFELIPIAGAEEQAAHLRGGAKVTVTCSPARGIEHTLLYAERLARQGLTVVPHIAARLVADTAHLKDILGRLAALDAREVFVVGGDAKQPAGPFASALDLLRAMADLGHSFAAIGVAAYPERHPLVDDETLLRALAEKQQFATYMVTQICFDPRIIGRWLRDVRQRGITLPAYVGLPGVVDKTQLLRISMKIGVGTSARFLSRNVGLAARLMKPGSYHPTELVTGLAQYLTDPEYSVAGLHINTFNQVESTEKWRRHMLSSLGDQPTRRHG